MHGCGVEHFDLKPANILLDENMNTVVIDFGIANVVGSDLNQRLISGLNNPNVLGITPGTVGTVQKLQSSSSKFCLTPHLAYASPELFRRMQTSRNPLPVKTTTEDTACDVYAFAIILYELLLRRHRRLESDSALPTSK